MQPNECALVLPVLLMTADAPMVVVEVHGSLTEACILRVGRDGDYRLDDSKALDGFVRRYPPAATKLKLQWRDEVIYRCIGGAIFMLQSKGYSELDVPLPHEHADRPDDGHTE